MNRLFALIAILPMFCSCSDNGMETSGEESVRILTVTPSTETRTSLSDNGTSGISAHWMAGDLLLLRNFSLEDAHTDELFAASSSTSTTFRGSVTCKQGDDLGIFYPAENNTSVLNYDGYGNLDLNLYGQDGTLSTIASRYDFCYARANVTSVNGFYATASFGTFTNLSAIMRMRFNCAGTILSNITSVEVYNEDFTPERRFSLTLQKYIEPTNVSKLYITCDNLTTVYIAIFEETNCVLKFTVTTSDGKQYLGILPEATYSAGGFYSTDLVVTEITG